MKNYNIGNFFLLYFVLLFSLIAASCNSTKRTKYFQDIPDSGALNKIAKVQYQEPVIQVDDILTVIVQTVDPAAAQSISSGNILTPASGVLIGGYSQNQTTNGYLVDKNGNIELPVAGKVMVSGLTTLEAKEKIRTAVSKYYNTQSVMVRFANFKINVTGEVTKPGTYLMPNEKVSILDALAMAGDLTIFGKRENILLVRENPDGTKTPYRINLKKSDVMTSPYYYLRQNDFIYVEPSVAKSAATDASQARTYTIIGSLLSVLVILATRI